MHKVPSPWWILSIGNFLLYSSFAEKRQETFFGTAYLPLGILLLLAIRLGVGARQTV